MERRIDIPLEECMSFDFINRDLSKAKNGVWFEHEAGRFLIGSPNKEEVAVFMEKRQAAIKKAHKGDKDYELKPSEIMSIAIEATVEFVLFDWDVKDKHGDELKFTKKAAKSALINDKEFNKYINECALSTEQYERDKREEKVKK